MTPTDDEALTRLRAALHTVADRTPISGGRLDEISIVGGEKQSRPIVTIVSAAAAVAAIAAVSAVVVGVHSSGSRALLPASGGSVAGSPTPSSMAPVASAVASPVPSPIPLAVASSTPSLSVAPGVAASLTAGCVPENYYVTASPSEVTGLTYMLPATPAGYHLYGAWGTISRNQCADSVTWYVDYDSNTGPVGSGGLQLMVTKVDGDAPAAGHSTPTPVAGTPITISGHEGFVIEQESSYAFIGWAVGDVQIALSGPVVHGDLASLVTVANALTLLSADDPRIVAPANCQVPPGSTCPSDSPTPLPNSALTASPSPSPTATAG